MCLLAFVVGAGLAQLSQEFAELPYGFAMIVSLHDIPDGGSLGVTLASGDRVCLFRRGGQVSALHDECTHQGMPLSAGEVLPDGSVECPFHGARFDSLTGAVRRGPADEDVRAYSVRVEGDTVLVEPRDDS